MKHAARAIAVTAPLVILAGLCVMWACPKPDGDLGGITITPPALDLGRNRRDASIVLRLSDPGGKAAAFEVHADKPWLNVAPASGSVRPGSPFPVVATVVRAQMKPGVNNGTLTLVIDGAPNATIPVRADAILAADFVATATEALTDEPVSFNDTSRVLTGADPIIDWQWDFGDGATSEQQNPVHTYATPGKFTVNLAVRSASLADMRTRALYIHVRTPVPPKAAFTAATTAPPVGVPVEFADLSVPGTSPITDWLWDFGDGAWSRFQNPTHLYTAAAVYDVYLTVNTTAGADTEIKLGYIEARTLSPASNARPVLP